MSIDLELMPYPTQAIIMPISEKGLRTKAKKREVEALQKTKINSELIPTFVELLCDVYTASRPKESDYQNRNDLIRIFNEIAKEIYGKGNDHPVVEGFGSFSMDLFSNKSDLDLSVNFGDNTVDFPKEKKIQALRKFAKKFYTLQSRGHVSGVQPIFFANVPILKVTDCGTGIECDISIENRDGIVKSKIVHLICSIDKRFHLLSFLTKAWAKAHGINSSKDRTLNSLSIISLVAFHLQTRHPPILPPFSAILKDGPDPLRVQKLVTRFTNYGKNNQETLGELFVTLLIKLASVETLWPKGLCASTYEGTWMLKTWENKYATMSVEDFTDRSQNVARAVGSGEVKRIYQCIQFSLNHIRSFMDGKSQAKKLRGVLFGREGVVGSARTVTTIPPIPFTAVLQKLIAIETTTSPEVVWGGAPIEGWPSGKQHNNNLVGKQNSNSGKRILQPCDDVDPIMPPIPFTAVLQKLIAIETNTSPEVVWGGAPIEGWLSGKHDNNLVGKQTSNSGKRILQPSDDVDPMMKKMCCDGCLEEKTMQPIPFTVVLKTIAAVETSTKPEVVWGGVLTEGWTSGNSLANGARK